MTARPSAACRRARSAQRRCPARVLGIVRQPAANAPSDSAASSSPPSTTVSCALSCVGVAHSWRTPCTSAACAANARSATDVVHRTTSSAARSVWAASAVLATNPSCSPSCLNWRYCRNPQSPSNPQSSTERFSPWNPRSKELTTTTAIPLHCPSPLLPTSARRLKAAVLIDIHGKFCLTFNRRVHDFLVQIELGVGDLQAEEVRHAHHCLRAGDEGDRAGRVVGTDGNVERLGQRGD